VILSPSGLNAVMTGHSYKGSDAGIDDILEEWKLFFQRRFTLDPSLPPSLPFHLSTHISRLSLVVIR